MFTQAVTTDTQKILHGRIVSLTEAKALRVIEFIDSLEEHEPNEETIAALEEADRISRDPNIKAYTNVEEMFAELRAECIE